MYTTRPPQSPLLTPLVQQYWFCELDVDHRSETIFASGSSQIVFGLHPDNPALSILTGPSTNSRIIEASHQRKAAGILLTTTGAAYLFGEDARNLVDQELSLDQIGRPQLGRLNNVLRNSASPHKVFEAIEVALLDQHKHARPQLKFDNHQNRVETAARLVAEGVAIGQIPALVNVERRKLSTLFNQTTGMGVKQYGRILRSAAAVSLLRRPEPNSISDIAFASGYADQAHLTREIREFCGVTPGHLRQHPSKTPNHLAEAT